MKRPRRQTLRGSVTQNTPVRLRADPPSRFSALYRLGILALAAAMLVIVAAWSWEVGWPQRQMLHVKEAALRLTGKAHFEVRDIIVEGRQQTGKDALALALGASADQPILAFNPAAAIERVQRLPWVASATIERRLPDTILVKLNERVPLARWQHDGHISVIDSEGRELTDARPDQFTALPMVVGSDAPLATHELLDNLRAVPAVTDKMTSAVRVSGRRWDIHLQAAGGAAVIARLPETGAMDALRHLQQLIMEQKILDRDVASIDLRIPDRLIIESATPAASAPSSRSPAKSRL